MLEWPLCHLMAALYGTRYYKDYPESAGINPVFFSRSGIPFIPEESFFYFKQKGPRKIRYLGRGRFVEPFVKKYR